MSKSLFRYLRGEVNGYYLNKLYNANEEQAKDIKDFLATFNAEQLDNLRDQDREGLSLFLGAYLPLLSSAESVSALFLTESEIVNGLQVSERGLFDTTIEAFEFVHTEQEEYDEDINTLATVNLRSSLVGEEDELIGYISSEETDLLNPDGTVKEEKVLSTPPTGVAYDNYYGSKFLFLAEENTTASALSNDLFVALVTALQLIRRNGTSWQTLRLVVEAVCPDGLVQLSDNLTYENNVYTCFYKYNSTLDVNLKRQRLLLLNYIVDMKFSNLVLSEIQ